MMDTERTDLAWLAGELSAIRRELAPSSESRALTLALDQGGTSSRAVLFDAVGREAATAHVPIATRRDGDRVEHDPEQLVQSLRTAIHDVCGSPWAAERPIEAVGLATQRSTVCCWDTSDGTALSPAISWQDRRHAQWLEQRLGTRATWVRELTGLPLSPHYGASKLRWCIDELPAVRLALRDERLALGPLASFLLHRLCVERPLGVDPANASRTLLFDPTLLDWSPALLEAFDIPRTALPHCVDTQQEFGTCVLDDGRRVPLRACSGDQSAALFAFGEPLTTTVFVNLGTGAFVQRAVRDGAGAPPRGLLRSVVASTHVAGVRRAVYCHEGTVNGGHAALEWLRGRVGLDVQRALAALQAESPAVEADDLLFMNGVGGLGAPFWLPDFPTEFTDLDGRVVAQPTDERRQLAAVVDSIAFLVATQVAAMRRASPLDRLVVTGGLAACDYLCEMLAAATGLRVERPALREATARGIAYLAAGQPSDWQPVPLDRVFDPSARADIAHRFERWRGAMAQRGAG
ncbi:MAG TPA: FGGY family carbohydrate kinase [Steroidobacteraceae bacterium]|nr:FGGY family carbohydrate kinase [Steroidobacteraceae bacterium]